MVTTSVSGAVAGPPVDRRAAQQPGGTPEDEESRSSLASHPVADRHPPTVTPRCSARHPDRGPTPDDLGAPSIGGPQVILTQDAAPTQAGDPAGRAAGADALTLLGQRGLAAVG